MAEWPFGHLLRWMAVWAQAGAFAAALLLVGTLGRVTQPAPRALLLQKAQATQQLWNAASNDAVSTDNVGKAHAYGVIYGRQLPPCPACPPSERASGRCGCVLEPDWRNTHVSRFRAHAVPPGQVPAAAALKPGSRDGQAPHHH